MSIENLKLMVKKVATIRWNLLNQKELESSVEFDLMATELGEKLTGIRKGKETISSNLEKAEAELRTASIEVYKETGERKPIDKVEVKLFPELEYEPKQVQRWSETYAPALLVLDIKSFEKDAKKGANYLHDAPVKVNEIPKCYIGSDLSMYLTETKEPDYWDSSESPSN